MPSLVLFKLTSASNDVEETLQRIFTLSNEVFGSTPGSSKYSNLEVWKKRLALPGAFILYLAPSSAAQEALSIASLLRTDGLSPVAASTPRTPVAFLFLHPQTHPYTLSMDVTDTLHLWLAGVASQQRRKGHLGRLIREAEDIAGTGAVLTTCTIPERFSDMWWWLTRRDWIVERQLEHSKVLLAKTLPRGSDVDGPDTPIAM